MKFFTAALALATAVMAAPTAEVAADKPPYYVKDTRACGCQNAAGQVIVTDLCTKVGGVWTREIPNSYCYAGSARSPDAAAAFTDERCASFYAEIGYNKAVCKTIQLCEWWPGQDWAKDTWVDCRERS